MNDYDWEAEHDIRMITEADDIRRDPARLARARGHLEDQRRRLDAAAKRLEPNRGGPRFNNGIGGKIKR